MSPLELQDYLHAHIPLSAFMQVRVVSVTRDAVEVAAPIGPNINHRETVFGGSASTLSILAAWSLLQTRLAAEHPGCRLVIQRNTMDYDLPVHGDFFARAEFEDAARWPSFLKLLATRGRARLAVVATLESAGTRAGRFRGEFVAIAAESRGRKG